LVSVLETQHMFACVCVCVCLCVIVCTCVCVLERVCASVSTYVYMQRGAIHDTCLTRLLHIRDVSRLYV